jgi:FAD dependent oxidoreductase
MNQLNVDIAIIGASLGGVLATWRACQAPHLRVALVAEYDWLGGQMTSQGVPPDEHHLIESGGASASYLAFRHAIRTHYLADANFIDHTELTEGTNPGDGWVSRLCFEPKLAAAYFENLLAPFVESGQLEILRHHKIVTATRDERLITAVDVYDNQQAHTTIKARYFCDATDTGDLLKHAKLPYRLGKESRHEFNEPDAPVIANTLDQQPVTFVMAVKKSDVVAQDAAPPNYAMWRDYIVPHYGFKQFSTSMPGEGLGIVVSLPLFGEGQALDWWRYRRIVSARNWLTVKPEVSLINWAQNDFAIAPLLDGDVAEAEVVDRAKNLSACFLYWLQHDAPHPNSDNKGYPYLQLDIEALGTADGFAQQVYVRESRRIAGLTTLTASDIVHHGGKLTAFNHPQSVGVAWYNMDIHPTCVSGHGVNAKVRPFTLPLGVFVSRDCDNLIPACKNISVTHLVNAATRVHPIEWLIGEVAAMLASYAIANDVSLAVIANSDKHVRVFQAQLVAAGIPIQWDDQLIATLQLNN